MMMGTGRTLRKSNDRVLSGVSGGIGEFFDLAPWGVRLLWVLMFMIGGPITLVAYIVMAFAMKPPISTQPPPIHGNPAFRCNTREEFLARMQDRLDRLNKRLQRMESIVTDPGFAIREECDRLR